MKKEIVLKVLVIHNSVLLLLVAGRNMNEVEKNKTKKAKSFRNVEKNISIYITWT